MDILESFNHSLFLAINGGDGASGWLVNLAIAIGDSMIYLVPIILLWLWLWLWGDRARRGLAIKGFAVAMLGVGVNQLIALAWQHPRPFMIGLGHAWIAHAADSSFPSDHVTVLAGVGLSMLFGGAMGLASLMLVFALAVAWARVFLGVHFPPDMIGAVIVAGMSFAVLTPIWHRLGDDFTIFSEQIYRKILAWPISAGWIRS